MNELGIVEILAGERKGQQGYQTWTDGEYVRVTPHNGSPFDSFEYKIDEVKMIDPTDI